MTSSGAIVIQSVKGAITLVQKVVSLALKMASVMKMEFVCARMNG